MANLKISELGSADALTGIELIEAVQGGVNKRTTTQAIADLAGGGTWGSITGTLSDQTDLQSALDEKAATTDVVGVQDLFIPASAMWPRSTQGCNSLAQYEMSTSLVNVQGLEFTTAAQQYAQFQIALPRKWNNGTVTAVIYWKPVTSGTGDVQWEVNGGAYSNDDALTVALGTEQVITDTFIATDDLHITSATPAITLAGTPADADFLIFQVSRDPSAVADTLDVNALLLGVSIRITTDAAKDA